MADEDLIPEGDGAPIDAPIIDDTPVDDPIASLASELGWVPKDDFKGDPEKWRPADEFIRAGRDIQKSQSSELKSIKQEVERFGRVASDLMQDRVRERDEYWQAQHTKAVDEGDHAAANLAVQERQKLAQAQASGPPAEVNEWIGRNSWFNTDVAAQLRAKEVSERLSKEGRSVSEQLEAAERIVRKEFPEHFPAKAKDPPSTQTGQSRKAAPSNRVKGFADMPADSQKMAQDMVRRNPGLTTEAIAKSYWADVNKEKVG